MWVRLAIIASALSCTFASGGQEGRVIGGWEAVEGQFPYAVSLRRNMFHFCGGTIVAPKTILTAAHCVYGFSMKNVIAVVGTNYLNSGGEAYPVFEGIYHEDYDPQTVLNDIAVIKLLIPIDYNKYVQPVVLSDAVIEDGDYLALAGWGWTTYPGSSPDSLQYVRMPSLNLKKCAEIMESEGPVGETHICTGLITGEGACPGDSGGPLVDYSYRQVGIVSWGVAPCGSGKPDVYTRVSAYKDWIEKHSD